MKMVHVKINTANLEESVKFYQDIIGLEIQEDLRKLTGTPVVFLASDEAAVKIELIENKEQAYSGDGIFLGFHVEDVEATREWMAEKGLNPTPMISPNPNTKFFFIKDLNGVNIQLI